MVCHMDKDIISDTRERGHAFTRVHAPPHVRTDTGTPPDCQRQRDWLGLDRSPGYPWPPVRGSRLWHARVVLHPVCTAAGRPAASVLQSSAHSESLAHGSRARTAFFEFVAYSSDDSNFARDELRHEVRRVHLVAHVPDLALARPHAPQEGHVAPQAVAEAGREGAARGDERVGAVR